MPAWGLCGTRTKSPPRWVRIWPSCSQPFWASADSRLSRAAAGQLLAGQGDFRGADLVRGDADGGGEVLVAFGAGGYGVGALGKGQSFGVMGRSSVSRSRRRVSSGVDAGRLDADFQRAVEAQQGAVHLDRFTGFERPLPLLGRVAFLPQRHRVVARRQGKRAAIGAGGIVPSFCCRPELRCRAARCEW